MLKLVMLSAGTPTPARDRFGTACVLRIADEVLMFDCGPAATHKLVKAGLRPTEVDYLFITHHHFDHMSDYPCFLLCRWDQSTGGERTLQVYGPEPIEWITDRLVGPDGAFSHDWRTRAYHPAATAAFENRGGNPPRPEPHYDIHQIEPGSVVERANWSVTAAQARHAPALPPTRCIPCRPCTRRRPPGRLGGRRCSPGGAPRAPTRAGSPATPAAFRRRAVAPLLRWGSRPASNRPTPP